MEARFIGVTRLQKLLYYLSLTYPIGFLLAMGIVFDIHPDHLFVLLTHTFYYFGIGLSWIVAYQLKKGSRLFWYTFSLVQVITAMHSLWIALEIAQTHHRFLALMMTYAAQSIFYWQISSEIRLPYFFPKIRWWEANSRLKYKASVRLQRMNEKSGSTDVKGEIVDLNDLGCFIKTTSELRPGEWLECDFTTFGIHFKLRGLVVWLAPLSVLYPQGIGVKFIQVGRKERKYLKLITKRLAMIHSLYRRYRYILGNEEYIKRLTALEQPLLSEFQPSSSQSELASDSSGNVLGQNISKAPNAKKSLFSRKTPKAS